MIKKIAISFSISFFFMSCQKNENMKTYKIDDNSSDRIDNKIELKKWKKELVESKQLGEPCRYKDDVHSQMKKYGITIINNNDQQNGIPDDENISIENVDLDEDGKKDLLMHFVSENCTGHNGGNPSYAKVVYANHNFKTDLMQEIKDSIINQFNKKKSQDKNLKDVTEDYFEETLTISYNNGLVGEFELYTKNDAHCCPSYNGKYFYNMKNKKMNIEIKENIK